MNEPGEIRYRRLLQFSPVPIVVHSDELVDFANQRAAEVLGLDDADELTGRSIWDWVPQKEQAKLRPRVHNIYARNENPQPVESRFLRADGEIFDVQVMSQGIVLGGRPAAEVVFHDISEAKRRERAELEHLRRRERAQKLESLGSLAAGIAHDFNNLLVGVMGHADLALEYLDAGTPPARHVEELGRGAQHAADLAQQLLDYAGEKRSPSTEIDLSSVVAEMGKLLEVSVKSRADLETELDEELPPISGDPTQLRQVIMNLILNAADAIEEDRQRGPSRSRRGTIRIRTRCTEGPQGPFDDDFRDEARGDDTRDDDDLCDAQSLRRPGPLVCLEIEDDGCGMDRPTRQRLFEPFHTTKPSGRGLGMATVLGIVRSHHGAIDVESEPDEGTRVCIAFPVPDTLR